MENFTASNTQGHGLVRRQVICVAASGNSFILYSILQYSNNI
jgi:hypothetical protein